MNIIKKLTTKTGSPVPSSPARSLSFDRSNEHNRSSSSVLNNKVVSTPMSDVVFNHYYMARMAMGKQTLDFTNFADVSKAIQKEKNVLLILGFGVTYIAPTRQSLEFLSSFAERCAKNGGYLPAQQQQVNAQNDEMNGKPKQRPLQLKVFLIDEEQQRAFCNQNELVVGAPLVQMYYNGKLIRFRFIRGAPPSQTAKSTDSAAGKKVSTPAPHDEDEDNAHESNVFIGQMHTSIIEYMIRKTKEAIDAVEGISSGESIVVELHMAELNPVLWQRGLLADAGSKTLVRTTDDQKSPRDDAEDQEDENIRALGEDEEIGDDEDRDRDGKDDKENSEEKDEEEEDERDRRRRRETTRRQVASRSSSRPSTSSRSRRYRDEEDDDDDDDGFDTDEDEDEDEDDDDY